MYSKKSWGGSVDPFIQVMFKQMPDASNEPVSLVIFEYNDKNLLGKPLPDDPDQVITYRWNTNVRMQTDMLAEKLHLRRRRHTTKALQHNASRRVLGRGRC